MANLTLEQTQTLIIHECPTCFVLHAIPKRMEHERLEDGGNVFCPNGHKWHFTVTESDKLKKQLADAERTRQWLDGQLTHEQDQRRAAERSAAAYKGQATRLRKRAAAGVCPVPECHRHFENLARHMTSKHPGFAAGEGVDLSLTGWARHADVPYQKAYMWFRAGQIEGARYDGTRIVVPSTSAVPGAAGP